MDQIFLFLGLSKDPYNLDKISRVFPGTSLKKLTLNALEGGRGLFDLPNIYFPLDCL